VGLLVVGLTNIISGSALSGLVLSFMRSEPQSGSTPGRRNFPSGDGFKAQAFPGARRCTRRPSAEDLATH
jgi:hypothetical protein